MPASTLAPPASPASSALPSSALPSSALPSTSARPCWSRRFGRVFKAAARDIATDRLPHTGTPYPLKFTGDGRTYFRFWLVNVLLAVITLGLYKPLARRRTAQYFYEHTLIAGSPLTFTGSKRSMMVGFVIAFLISVLWKMGGWSGLDLFIALSLVGITLWTPFVWASAQRFRLGNTRWRGLRLRFTARWTQVYRAYWPSFASSTLVLALLAAWWAMAPFETRGMFDFGVWLEAFFVGEENELTDAMGWLFWAALLVMFLLSIMLDYNLRDLRVRHTWLGVQPASWQRPSFFTFAKIWTMALVLVLLLPGLLWWGVETVLELIFGDGPEELAKFEHHFRNPWVIISVIFGAVLFLLLMFVLSSPGRAYYHARVFRLMWSRMVVHQADGAEAAGDAERGRVLARFGCTLSTGAWVRLRFKNALLRLLTLGFYGPLATLAEYRMKLESVTLYVEDDGDLDQLVGAMTRKQSGALGDALADVAGLELIG